MNATNKLLKNTNEPSSIHKHCSRCSTLSSVRPSCQRPAVRNSDPRGNDCEDPDTPPRRSCESLAASSVPIGSVFREEARSTSSRLFLNPSTQAAERTRVNGRESFRLQNLSDSKTCPTCSRTFFLSPHFPSIIRQTYLSSLLNKKSHTSQSPAILFAAPFS